MKNKLILSLTVLFLILISFGVFTKLRFKSSASNPTPSGNIANSYPPDELQQMQEKESTVISTAEEVAQTYIQENFPESTNITLQSELLGQGFGIMKAAYRLNGSQKARKIYLEYTNDKWEVIYYSEATITCTKVKELISGPNVLLSFCK